VDYVSRLLRAINDYNDTDDNSKETLRDLICVISDNAEIKADPFIRKLLYVASQKMRVFGYNILNQLGSDPDETATELSLTRDESIKEIYRSQVWENNILDKTQKEIIDFFQSLPDGQRRMLVSAPTSYGKTFIMREILYINRHRYNNILLVFPTVALLRENAENMEKLNREKGLGYSVIKSVDNEFDITAKNIFVFTPERAMQLLAGFDGLNLDFFFYDEMYKIDEDFCYDETDEKEENEEQASPKKKSRYSTTASFLDEARAKTFRICLYMLSKLVPEYYLAGPNLSEEHFGYGMKAFLQSNRIHVKSVLFEPTKRIRVDSFASKIKEHIEGLPIIPISEERVEGKNKGERICAVVDYIKRHNYGQTLLYCTTPAKANDYATILAVKNQGSLVEDNDYCIFMDHIRRAYDVNGSIEQWSFFKVLQKGFAMHHRKLPKYIQKEVLDLFNRGMFDLLFCTSTIVEGVNTNAKNMVILNASKGKAKLTGFDLKNIIGRAGRYYHNFIGRYYLFDRELVTIVDEKLILDFITYGERELGTIDLDNADMLDLTHNNRQAKQTRIEQQSGFALPEEVFRKNRLVKKEQQESLLRHLLRADEDFYKFHQYLKYPNILEEFIEYPALNVILRIFQAAGLIDEFTVKYYTAISIGYVQDGFYGILKYQIKQAESADIKYDGAYSKAFKTQKDIIEHKIPKLLALFESIFLCAASIRGISTNNFSLSKVIRFYEAGVRSYLGEQLVEYGFPIDAIRRIEAEYPQLTSLGCSEAKLFVKQNSRPIMLLLDEYERRLLRKAFLSLN